MIKVEDESTVENEKAPRRASSIDPVLLEWREPRRYRGFRWLTRTHVGEQPYAGLLSEAVFWGVALLAILTLGRSLPVPVQILLSVVAAVLIVAAVNWRILFCRARITVRADGLSRRCGGIEDRWKFTELMDYTFESRLVKGEPRQVFSFTDSAENRQQIILARQSDQQCLEELLRGADSD